MKDPRVFIFHILESIELIYGYLQGSSKDDFLSGVQLQDAIIRRFEVIGEAVRNIPREFRARYPDVPWQKAAGFRDIMIHRYFKIDFSIVWDTATGDLPGFERQLRAVLADLDGGSDPAERQQ